MTTTLNALSPPMLLGFQPPWIRYVVKAQQEREERAMRRLLLLDLPLNVDDMTLAKRLGHHEMVPEEFGWLMGCKT